MEPVVEPYLHGDRIRAVCEVVEGMAVDDDEAMAGAAVAGVKSCTSAVSSGRMGHWKHRTRDERSSLDESQGVRVQAWNTFGAEVWPSCSHRVVA